MIYKNSLFFYFFFYEELYKNFALVSYSGILKSKKAGFKRMVLLTLGWILTFVIKIECYKNRDSE